MEKQYRRTKKTVSLINYHFVFCSRYRRKILVEEVEKRFREILNDICKELGLTIISVECDKDYCHIYINALPTLSPTKIMANIKGVSSRIIRKEFEHLSHLPSLWTRSYFVSTADNVSSKMIKSFVEEQKTRG